MPNDRSHPLLPSSKNPCVTPTDVINVQITIIVFERELKEFVRRR